MSPLPERLPAGARDSSEGDASCLSGRELLFLGVRNDALFKISSMGMCKGLIATSSCPLKGTNASSGSVACRAPKPSIRPLTKSSKLFWYGDCVESQQHVGEPDELMVVEDLAQLAQRAGHVGKIDPATEGNHIDVRSLRLRLERDVRLWELIGQELDAEQRSQTIQSPLLSFTTVLSGQRSFGRQVSLGASSGSFSSKMLRTISVRNVEGFRHRLGESSIS